MTESLRASVQHLEFVQRYYSGEHFHLLELDAAMSHLTEMRVLDLEKVYDARLFRWRFDLRTGEPMTLPDEGRFTERENPVHKALLWCASQSVESALRKMNVEVPTAVLGTLPHHEPNAHVQLSPSGIPMVLCNAGLFRLLSALSQAIAMALPSTGRIDETGLVGFSLNPDPARIAAEASVHDSFVEAVAGYFGPSPQKPSLYPFNYFDSDGESLDARGSLYCDFFLAAITFVVAHEYAHIVLRHRRRRADEPGETVRFRRNPDGGGTIWPVSAAQEQELEADALAFIICSNAFRPRCDVATIFLGAELFFICCEVVEAFQGPADRGQHPEPSDRAIGLRTLLTEVAPAETEMVRGVCSDVRRVLNFLFQANEHRLSPPRIACESNARA